MEQKALEKKPNKVIPYRAKPRVEQSSSTTPIGKAIIPKTRYFVKDGKRYAEPDKGIDLISYLKSSQASTDIASIMARYASGDSSVLNVRADGLSGDFSQMPRSVNDMNDLRNKMKQTFESLKPEVQAKFTDFADFYSCCLDGSLSKRVGFLKKGDVNEVDKVLDKKAEVKAEEHVDVPEAGKEEK